MKRLLGVIIMLLFSSYSHANETTIPDEINSIITDNLPEQKVFEACAIPSGDKTHPHWFVGLVASEAVQKKAVLSNNTLAIDRIGVVWLDGKYHFQNIDADISKDLKKASFQTWVADTQQTGRYYEDFVTKCGLNNKNSKNLSFKDFKPYFSLSSLHLTQKDVVCHTTSDVYGNWDCLVFHPKKKRFVYWFQQLYAD